MAKQTFTTGSVLTATQMNNLQANDYNWTVSQKTASYVLVAADAGTRIEMNTASNTTVTVNTGLFAAGDTLFIQNIGSGSCVITAGTATVQKAANASLTLSQYQGGYLYFVSASNAVFFADAGFTSPLTTKGDLFTWDTGNARLAVGTNGQVLTADSTAATGIKWATAGSSKNYSLLNGPSGTTMSGAATYTVSSLSGYENFLVIVEYASTTNAGARIGLRINGDSGSNYQYAGPQWQPASTYASSFMGGFSSSGNAQYVLGFQSSNVAGRFDAAIQILGGNNTGFKAIQACMGSSQIGGNDAYSTVSGGIYKATAVVSSISIITDIGTFDGGTLYVWGAQ